MSQVVKKKPPAREVVREGAAEVGAKLKSDLSRWTRVRRVVSLRPMIGCMDCDATGKLVCEACSGTGRTKVQINEEAPLPCPHCDGSGQTTCVACAGQGEMPNVHRKKFLWLLIVGGIAWVLLLLQLWGRDLFPAQVAAVTQRGEHGQSAFPGTSGGPATHGGMAVPRSGGIGAPISGGMAAPGGGGNAVPQVGNMGAPAAGGSSMPSRGPVGGGMTVPGGGGYAAPQGGGNALPQGSYGGARR
jgi:hypothetical protein